MSVQTFRTMTSENLNISFNEALKAADPLDAGNSRSCGRTTATRAAAFAVGEPALSRNALSVRSAVVALAACG